jgi:hypothetical protein
MSSPLKNCSRYVIGMDNNERKTHEGNADVWYQISKAGLAVGKLRSNAAPGVSSLAREIVKAWKDIIEENKRKRKRDEGDEGGEVKKEGGEKSEKAGEGSKRVKKEEGMCGSRFIRCHKPSINANILQMVHLCNHQQRFRTANPMTTNPQLPPLLLLHNGHLFLRLIPHARNPGQRPKTA